MRTGEEKGRENGDRLLRFINETSRSARKRDFLKVLFFYCDLVLFKVFLKVLCATYVYIDDERMSNITMLAKPGVNNVF